MSFQTMPPMPKDEARKAIFESGERFSGRIEGAVSERKAVVSYLRECEKRQIDATKALAYASAAAQIEQGKHSLWQSEST